MKILSKTQAYQTRLVLPRLTRYFPLNPSFVIYNNKLKIIYRGCNYNLRVSGYQKFLGSWTAEVSDSQNYFAEASLDLKLLGCDFIEDRHIRAREDALDGIQDLKLFNWKNEIYATGSGLNSAPLLLGKSLTRKFTMMLFKLSKHRLEFVSTLPSFQNEEKNWMPWVKNENLWFVYRPNPFSIFSYDILPTHSSQIKSINYTVFGGAYSGGSCAIPCLGGYLGLVHKRTGRTAQSFYDHRLFFATDDFRIAKVSEPFTFDGENIEYGSSIGLANDSIYLGYGSCDAKAIILQIDRDHLFKSLNWFSCVQNQEK